MYILDFNQFFGLYFYLSLSVVFLHEYSRILTKPDVSFGQIQYPMNGARLVTLSFLTNHTNICSSHFPYIFLFIARAIQFARSSITKNIYITVIVYSKRRHAQCFLIFCFLMCARNCI